MKKTIVTILVVIIAVILGFLAWNTYTNEIEIEGREAVSSEACIEENLACEIPKIEKQELSLLMVGDALYHNDVYGDGKNRVEGKEYDYTHNLVHMKDIVEKYDLAYYNQETILRRSRNRAIKLPYIQFTTRSRRRLRRLRI